MARLIEQLRAETQGAREALERLPYFLALREGALPREARVNFLRALAHLHEALEDALGLAEGITAEVWHEGMSKLPHLARDLAALGDDAPEVPRAAAQAIALAEQLRARAAGDPAWALGYLYVLEGSTPDEEGERWQALSTRINALVLDPAARDRTFVVAREALEGLAEVVAALHPPAPDDWASLVGALNPDAGHHPITDDPTELRAALRAGERTWHRFPYYELRYGPRGRRFMRSDSGWLAHLTRQPAAELERQIMWLGSVLASRGMPRWLLECHLEDLFVELARARPDARARYALLRAAAARLRDARVARIDGPLSARLDADFDEAVGPDLKRRLPHAGCLIASAVADEADGQPRAVASLVEWLASPERFPPPWVAAVTRTLDDARSLVRGAPRLDIAP
jgi:heme oxygenase